MKGRHPLAPWEDMQRDCNSTGLTRKSPKKIFRMLDILIGEWSYLRIMHYIQQSSMDNSQAYERRWTEGHKKTRS